jgi:hypothetical protein
VDLAAVNAPVPAGIAVAFEGEAPQPLGFTEIFDLLVGMADVPVGADKAQRIAAAPRSQTLPRAWIQRYLPSLQSSRNSAS